VTVCVRVDVRGEQATRWREALARALPEARFDDTATDVDYLIAWRPAVETLQRVRVRKAVFNLGAGVDALLGVPTLPPGIAIYRLADAGMAEQMAEYAVMTVLRAYREMEIRGLLDTEQGTGTFIADRKIEYSKDDRDRKLKQLVGEIVSRAGAAGFTLKQVMQALRDIAPDEDVKRK